MNETLYTKVVSLTEQYLGPAAPRFIDRHIIFHLDKKPQDITRDDLEKLKTWTSVSLALLTSDREIIDEFAAKLTQL